MPMEFDKYEGLVNELLDPELDHSRRTEILTEMKQDYSATISEVGELNTKVTDLDKKRLDLLDANSKLFRQIPTSHTKTEEEKQKQATEERAKTLTISDLEN